MIERTLAIVCGLFGVVFAGFGALVLSDIGSASQDTATSGLLVMGGALIVFGLVLLWISHRALASPRRRRIP